MTAPGGRKVRGRRGRNRKIRNFAKKPKAARKPAFGRNSRFRRRCGWHVPGRTRAAAVRHVLRGCLGIGISSRLGRVLELSQKYTSIVFRVGVEHRCRIRWLRVKCESAQSAKTFCRTVLPGIGDQAPRSRAAVDASKQIPRGFAGRPAFRPDLGRCIEGGIRELRAEYGSWECWSSCFASVGGWAVHGVLVY